MTIPCELGKQYQLQSVTALGSTNWVVETNVVVRSGTTLTLMAAAGSVGKFFRTAVSDVDTDGAVEFSARIGANLLHHAFGKHGRGLGEESA